MLSASFDVVVVAVGAAVLGAPKENVGGAEIEDVDVAGVADEEAKLKLALGAAIADEDVTAIPDEEGNPKPLAALSFKASFPVG